jgi:hypothetical protein
MTRSTKAALLSGLVFPGVGHMVLKRFLRGSILMLSALTALLVIVTKVTKQDEGMSVHPELTTAARRAHLP